mgnify:CR=1 FL=1
MTTGGSCISTYLVVSAWRLLECRVFPRSRHHHLRPIQFRRANRSAGQRPGLGFNAPSYAAPGTARNSIRAIRLADHSGLPVSSFLQLESYQKYQLTESLLQNSPTRFTAPHSIRPLRAICVVREASIAERLSLWHGFRRLRRTTACIPRMHGGGRGNAGGHSRNRINWSADRARIPNIKCAITLVAPLTIKVLPPNSSLSRALLRSAAVRSL